MKIWQLSTNNRYKGPCGYIKWSGGSWTIYVDSYGNVIDKDIFDVFKWDEIMKMEVASVE